MCNGGFDLGGRMAKHNDGETVGSATMAARVRAWKGLVAARVRGGQVSGDGLK